METKIVFTFTKSCIIYNIIKLQWLKQKKVILIALAVVFLVALFFTKTSSTFKNQTENSGLVYNGNEKIEDLVNRDTDGDSVPDWEEGLFGTDPTKKDTNDDGISDGVEIARRSGQTPTNGELNLNFQEPENLTETDKLSRELFSTVAALNQAGQVDQNTIDTLSNSLIEKISNSTAKKTYLLPDIKVTKADNAQVIKNYSSAISKTFDKYSVKYTVFDVLDKFFIDENNVDESVLPQLDPIIKQTKDIINELTKMNVPEGLAFLHLDALNALEKLSENISDIRVYDTDVVVAMSGISQYQANADTLETTMNNLVNAINQRLK